MTAPDPRAAIDGRYLRRWIQGLLTDPAFVAGLRQSKSGRTFTHRVKFRNRAAIVKIAMAPDMPDPPIDVTYWLAAVAYEGPPVKEIARFMVARDVPDRGLRSAGIIEVYQRAGGPLALRALAFATADTVGYIIGAWSSSPGSPDAGKFILVLARTRGEPWRIVADMDNGNTMRP